MRPLVILRPEPGASATAQAARRLGVRPVLLSLFRLEPVAWIAPDPSQFDALLVTSANAIRFGGPKLRKLKALPVYAVGEATATAARDEGFDVEAIGRGGVDALLKIVPRDRRLVHLCGADRRETADGCQSIAPIRVYRSAELPLPDNFQVIEGAVVAVHSPRAARRLVKLNEEALVRRDRTAIAAISGQAAASAGGGWQRVESAERPDDRALLALAARLCHNGGQ